MNPRKTKSTLLPACGLALAATSGTFAGPTGQPSADAMQPARKRTD